MIYHQIRLAVQPDAPQEQAQHAMDPLRQMGANSTSANPS
jgi:hypothetical protein